MSQKLNCLQTFACRILRKGKIPKHIAFIMDGNRRYAKNIGKSALQGHQYGVQALRKCLLLCSSLQIQIVTLYCFSLENFNRAPEQVQRLMELVLETFEEFSQVSEIINENNIKVNVVGNLERMDQSVAQALKDVQNRTSNNKSMVINLCFAYDSIYEINLAKQKLGKEGTYQQFKNNLLIKQEVDIMVRTSNQWRLSNFLLVQAQHCQLSILKENWPEIGLLSFVKILLEYNYNYKSLKNSHAD